MNITICCVVTTYVSRIFCVEIILRAEKQTKGTANTLQMCSQSLRIFDEILCLVEMSHDSKQ